MNYGRKIGGASGQNGKETSLAPGPRAGGKPPFSQETQALALSAWDLARTRRHKRETPRGQVMTLRAHKRLAESAEAGRGIMPADRSLLLARENARGSCLLIPGVSSRPMDLYELAKVLFDQNFNVQVLSFPEFGSPGHTIGKVSWESSLFQTRQRFQLLKRGGGDVHVIGLGFGAPLAMYLASTENVTSLVLLAPALMPRESLLRRLVVRLKLHRIRFIHRLLGSDVDLVEGMKKACGLAGKIKVPIYGAQCEDDDKASPDFLRILQRKAQNPASRFQIFPDGGHAILAAHGQGTLYREIKKFLMTQ